MKLGAKGGFDYRDASWTATAMKTTGQFDVVVDSAGGEGFAKLIDATASGGRLVTYGATRGEATLAMRKIFWRQISVLGTTMGSPDDWSAMISFVGERRLQPIVSDVFPLDGVADAFGLMERSEQFGKIVVKVAG
jgi:NADPH:quinone reductase-like Zn-dependent oxidoreductase